MLLKIRVKEINTLLKIREAAKSQSKKRLTVKNQSEKRSTVSVLSQSSNLTKNYKTV